MNNDLNIQRIFWHMMAKGYLIRCEDGKYSPSDVPPPATEDQELIDFWKYLTDKAIEKRKYNNI